MLSKLLYSVSRLATDGRQYLKWTAGALLLGASSCASLAPPPASTAMSAPASVGAVHLSSMPAQAELPVAASELTRAQNPAASEFAYEQPFGQSATEIDAAMVAPPYEQPASLGPIRSVSHEVTARNDVQLSQGGPYCPQPAYAAPGCPQGFCGTYATDCNTHFPDEYICDGGDKDIPVHYFENQRFGLNFEDTVGEFVDSDGEPQVRPSCRVCVYAPRFASVRTIDVSHVDISYNNLAGHHDDERLVGVDHQLQPDVETQADQLIGLDRRDSAGGVIADVWEGNLTKIDWVGGNVQVNRLWQDIGFVRDGMFHQEDEARLAMSIQIAHDWSHDLYPIIMADTLQGGIVDASFRAADMTGIHDPRCPGELRIVKLCEQESALPGDTITFVIRYDNIGQKELTEVRILDNLSPRLELKPESVSFDRAGTPGVQDNGAGGRILVFELEEPLPGETGGVLTFDCLVR